MNKEELIKFEEEVVDMYKQGKLRSPIHLSGSQDGKLEDFLIKIFKKIKKEDWVFSTYRSHYHALLKGIKPEWLKDWILNNKSIHVMNEEHKFFTSAIVGGCLPIALGVAMAIKLKGGKERVWIFHGDMTATTGAFSEAWHYATNHKLPITFVIEDNGLSTDTITNEVWNADVSQGLSDMNLNWTPYFEYIKYKRKYPHYGCGFYVEKFAEDK